MTTVAYASAAQISRILRESGLTKSESGYGRVSSVTNEGFQVIKDIDGVVVRYVSSSIPMRSDKSVADFNTRKLIALTDIYVALSDKGFVLNYFEGRGWLVKKRVA